MNMNLNYAASMIKHRPSAIALAAAILLTACGGGADNAAAPKTLQGATLARSAAATVSADAYVDAVQKIYIGYFGRPADPDGLANFTAYLSSIGAPTDIGALADAYAGNAQLRAVVDTFAGSAESAALYPGNTTQFVTAVYQHLLNRDPDAGGLAFWVGAIDNGVLSKTLASLSIIAATSSNGSDQGKLDAILIANKTSAANYFVTTLKNATGGIYAGDAAAGRARDMLALLTASTDNTAFHSVIDGVVTDLAAGASGGSAQPFPLRAGYMNLLSRGLNYDGTISGTCIGTNSSKSSKPVSVTFEGKNAYAVTATQALVLSNCTPQNFNLTTIQYFDTNFVPLGTMDPGSEYTVFLNAVTPLPVRVAVGDSGSFGSQSIYTDSGKATLTGRRDLSYAIEADAASTSNAPSAVFNLIARSYNTANQLLSTRQVRYRVNTAGTATPLSDDTQYSTTSTVRLLTKAQPATLSKTDTVIGSGTEAATGKTLTVNYTGWLYDASTANSRGAQFDSSIGRAPFTFEMGKRVIEGFNQGMAGMKPGGKRTIIIPASLGYGAGGSGAAIPPGAGLVFDVELISVN